MAQTKEKMVKLAFVAHPHGIRGEAELRLLNPEHEESILEEGMQVWLFPTNSNSKLSPQGEEWSIQKLRFGNKVICQFEGMKDRSHLETLIPFELFVSREAFPENEEGEVYLVDLIDLPVESPEGEVLGYLESFSDNGMQYLLDIRLKNGEKVTLPYVEAFFPKIDMEEKKIIMIMPEYTE